MQILPGTSRSSQDILGLPLGATAPKLCNFSPRLKGSSTASFNFTFTSSSPPISSHRVLGISKETSRKALGFTWSLAASKSGIETVGGPRAEPLRILSACSLWYLRKADKAACPHKAWMSAPTNPCEALAVARICRVTASSS